MAQTTIKMPRVADTTDEVVLLEWLVAVGEKVSAGDVLARVETDKVEVDIPSPVTGVVEELLVTPDTEVSTGAPICVFET